MVASCTIPRPGTASRLAHQHSAFSVWAVRMRQRASHWGKHILQSVISPFVLLLVLRGRGEASLRPTLRRHVDITGLVELHGAGGAIVLGIVIVVAEFVATGPHAIAHAHAAHATTRRALRAALDGRDGAHATGRALVGLLLLRALELAQVRGVVVVLLLHLLADGDQVPHALDVVRVRMVDVLVELQGLRIGAHATVARRHHEPPLHLGGLDLRGPAEEGNGRLVHLLLDIVDAQPSDDVHVHGPIPVRLEVVVEGLRLVPGLVEEVGQTREHAGIGWPTLGGRDQEREPLVGLRVVSELLVNVAKLPHDLAVQVRDGVELVEREEGLLVLPDVHVHEPKVVDRLEAVRADANRLEVHLLRALEFVVHEHAVALVHQGAGVVAVGLHGNVCVLLRVLVLGLEEVQEGEVGRRTCHERWLLSLEFLQHSDSLVEFFAAQEIGRLGNLELRADAGEAVVVQGVDHPIEAQHRRLIHHGTNQVRRIHDETRCLALPPLHILAEGVVALCEVAILAPPRG
mmetsp:Transcript_3456/g.9276  ORF Transcript_3456/g.9276 Transcript_3456/m.9276 type:complete len:517 (-) Transcript_3456:885-2435(-)